MADDVAACVREVIAIANGDGTVAESRHAAEQQVAKLLKGEAEKTLSHHSIAQDLRDRLGDALNAEHDNEARDVLDERHFARQNRSRLGGLARPAARRQGTLTENQEPWRAIQLNAKNPRQSCLRT